MSGINPTLEQLKLDPLEYKRQTGRSMRMMLTAAKLAEDGQRVLVVFKDEMAAKHWREKFGSIPNLTISPMRLDTKIDWERGRVIGDNMYDSHFIDHDVVWAYNKAIFALFNRYDRPMDQTPYTTYPSMSQLTPPEEVKAAA